MPDPTSDPRSRPTLSLRIVMVAIAYVAIVCAGGLASYRDHSRLDVVAAVIALAIGGNIIPRLMIGRGRDQAAYWGFALASIASLAALTLAYGSGALDVEAKSGIAAMLGVNFGLPWLTVLIGYLGAWIARRGFDRRSAQSLRMQSP